MSEKVLNDGLSGLEARKAAVARIEEVLAGDCFLTDAQCYSAVTMKFHIELTLQDVADFEVVTRDVEVKLGEEDLERPGYELEVDGTLDPVPPNVLRRETGQPIPIAGQDEQGRPVTKHAKYAPKGNSLGKTEVQRKQPGWGKKEK